MAVKANQPDLPWDLERLFADPALVAETGPRTVTWDKGHGRLERRELRASGALVGYTDWPGLAQALRLDRRVVATATGEVRAERASAVTSLPPERADAATLLALWRGHWGIENCLHWVRDVTFDEDRSRVRSGAAPQALAATRNLAIGLPHAPGHHQVQATRERLAGAPGEALRLLGLCRE